MILPSLAPALLTGFALAFARAVGEYGSVIFIAGNLPNVSEIAPLLIVIKLSSNSTMPTRPPSRVVMLSSSFVMLFAINRLQRWAQSRIRRAEAIMTMQIADSVRCRDRCAARARGAARDSLRTEPPAVRIASSRWR